MHLGQQESKLTKITVSAARDAIDPDSAISMPRGLLQGCNKSSYASAAL